MEFVVEKGQVYQTLEHLIPSYGFGEPLQLKYQNSHSSRAQAIESETTF